MQIFELNEKEEMYGFVLEPISENTACLLYYSKDFFTDKVYVRLVLNNITTKGLDLNNLEYFSYGIYAVCKDFRKRII